MLSCPFFLSLRYNPHQPFFSPFLFFSSKPNRLRIYITLNLTNPIRIPHSHLNRIKRNRSWNFIHRDIFSSPLIYLISWLCATLRYYEWFIWRRDEGWNEMKWDEMEWFEMEWNGMKRNSSFEIIAIWWIVGRRMTIILWVSISVFWLCFFWINIYYIHLKLGVVRFRFKPQQKQSRFNQAPEGAAREQGRAITMESILRSLF